MNSKPQSGCIHVSVFSAKNKKKNAAKAKNKPMRSVCVSVRQQKGHKGCNSMDDVMTQRFSGLTWKCLPVKIPI